jgi:hypothetical protein
MTSITELDSRTAVRRRGVRFFCQCLSAGFNALFIFGLLVSTEPKASAYTDPGTGTLMWQMLAAGFVGAMFYFRKFTSWFKSKNSENKN